MVLLAFLNLDFQCCFAKPSQLHHMVQHCSASWCALLHCMHHGRFQNWAAMQCIAVLLYFAVAIQCIVVLCREAWREERSQQGGQTLSSICQNTARLDMLRQDEIRCIVSLYCIATQHGHRRTQYATTRPDTLLGSKVKTIHLRNIFFGFLVRLSENDCDQVMFMCIFGPTAWMFHYSVFFGHVARRGEICAQDMTWE